MLLLILVCLHYLRFDFFDDRIFQRRRVHPQERRTKQEKKQNADSAFAFLTFFLRFFLSIAITIISLSLFALLCDRSSRPSVRPLFLSSESFLSQSPLSSRGFKRRRTRRSSSPKEKKTRWPSRECVDCTRPRPLQTRGKKKKIEGKMPPLYLLQSVGASLWCPPGAVGVVTGANKGIGLEIAAGLAANGLPVVAAVRSEERGRAAVEAIRSRAETRAEVSFLRLDVSSDASVADFAKNLRAVAPAGGEGVEGVEGGGREKSRERLFFFSFSFSEPLFLSGEKKKNFSSSRCPSKQRRHRLQGRHLGRRRGRGDRRHELPRNAARDGGGGPDDGRGGAGRRRLLPLGAARAALRRRSGKRRRRRRRQPPLAPPGLGLLRETEGQVGARGRERRLLGDRQPELGVCRRGQGGDGGRRRVAQVNVWNFGTKCSVFGKRAREEKKKKVEEKERKEKTKRKSLTTATSFPPPFSTKNLSLSLSLSLSFLLLRRSSPRSATRAPSPCPSPRTRAAGAWGPLPSARAP